MFYWTSAALREGLMVALSSGHLWLLQPAHCRARLFSCFLSGGGSDSSPQPSYSGVAWSRRRIKTSRPSNLNCLLFLEGFLLWSSWLAWPTGIFWILHQLFSLGMTFGEGWLSLQSGLFSPSPQDATGTNLASSHCHILTSKAVWT